MYFTMHRYPWYKNPHFDEKYLPLCTACEYISTELCLWCNNHYVVIIICSVVWSSSSDHSTTAYSSKHKSVRGPPRPVLFIVYLVMGSLGSFVRVVFYPKTQWPNWLNPLLKIMVVALVIILFSHLFTQLYEWWWSMEPDKNLRIYLHPEFHSRNKEIFLTALSQELVFSLLVMARTTDLLCPSTFVLDNRFRHLPWGQSHLAPVRLQADVVRMGIHECKHSLVFVVTCLSNPCIKTNKQIHK